MSIMRAKAKIQEALAKLEPLKVDVYDIVRVRELLKEALRELDAPEPAQTKLASFDEQQMRF